MNKILTLLLPCLTGIWSPVPAQKTAAIDSLMAAYSGEVPGAALMVIRNGKPVLTRTYGWAVTETRTPVTANTNFRLASVTKQFTATAILQLVQKGRISLQQNLLDFFPDLPAYGKRITLEHLLTHTSGIADYEDYVADSAMHPQLMDQGVLEIVKRIDTVYFQPGIHYRYSNTAYALLALIVEKYSGQPFVSYLQENIFGPLQMKNSLAYIKGVNEVPNRAYGYTKTPAGWERKDQSSTSAVLGDGGIYANLADLYLWDQALYTTKMLPASLLKESFSYHYLNNSDTVHYGYGWHLKKSVTGGQVVYHTGSTTSFRNIFYRIPEKKFSIILLTNRNRPEEEDMLALAEKIEFIMNK